MENKLIDVEASRCLDSFEYLLKYKGLSEASELINSLIDRYHVMGGQNLNAIHSPYINSPECDAEFEYPGNLEYEDRLINIMRWNAMAMVVTANRNFDGVGGHISTYASTACLYEIGYNHFFRGNGDDRNADQIFFQGHGSPGNYSRAFMEGRLTSEQLHHFRLELGNTNGLSSYPHPYLMPDFWQFPTVSMGLGPINAIYQARFNRYLLNRGLLSKDDSTVWAFLGDGEMDEPESTSALPLAAREKLDNIIFVINCNLQRLDGPVRGNGKVIQELEGIFKGAGWNVIKLLWGSDWDELLQSPHRELLIKRMGEALDGDYQKYLVSSGSYIRKHFFGKYPELLECVNHLTDLQLTKLLRGGHDSKKIYAAYKAAKDYKEGPTVILAKTVKGYGLGEAGEGKNISHQQKKLNEKELREFRERFDIPIGDDEIVETPFYLLKEDAPEMKYLHQQRKKLGGYLPERLTTVEPLSLPPLSEFKAFFEDSGKANISTTMALVRMLTILLRDKNLGKFIVPIVPDEARTFGMEAFFRQFGIYSPKGQQYEPADSDSLLYYREVTDGQILEEGINEAGAMASFVAAGSAYATHGINMIPFYIYYSMFGFQRIGDMAWLAGDMQCKGFLIGGTAGRTTLNGEGLQHQDGHSHLLASTIPNVLAYDVAFRYEIAIIVREGIRRMYVENEQLYYYLTVGNENYHHPAMPKNTETGIINGLYKFSKSKKKNGPQGHIFGSGSLMQHAIEAAEILEKDYGMKMDVWGATSYKRLRHDAMNTERQNMLNPKGLRKKSYLEEVLENESGSFVAVSDNMKIVSDQISEWVPGGLFSLGTDGFGRSATREQLRRFFEVDTSFIVLAVLYKSAKDGAISSDVVEKAIVDLEIDREKVHPILKV